MQVRGAKLAAAQRQEADALARRDEADVAAAALQRGVSELFVAARCDPAATRSLLGEGEVTEENVMQYLGILEQRAAELVHSIKEVSGMGSAGLPTMLQHVCWTCVTVQAVKAPAMPHQRWRKAIG